MSATPNRVSPIGLVSFVEESNRIEGIHSARYAENEAHGLFIAEPVITPSVLVRFVSVVQPGARLRDEPGLNVRVGNHVPAPGGPDIVRKLDALLDAAHAVGADPYEIHRDYETLHPFTDGNGRSGRVLWLWMMLTQGRDPYVLHRGFLHTWYYQSLAAKSEGEAAR